MTYIVKTPNPDYCGIGAGGVQFAYGQAEVNEGWVLDWYRERGYKVEPKEEPKKEADKSEGKEEPKEEEATGKKNSKKDK